MDPRSSLYSTSMTSASLGPRSALGEKGKNRRSLGRGKGGPVFRWARFAHRYFSYLTPFFAFFPTAEPGPWLTICIKTRLTETKTSPKKSSFLRLRSAGALIARKFLPLYHRNTRLGCVLANAIITRVGSRIFLRGGEGAPLRMWRN